METNTDWFKPDWTTNSKTQYLLVFILYFTLSIPLVQIYVGFQIVVLDFIFVCRNSVLYKTWNHNFPNLCSVYATQILLSHWGQVMHICVSKLTVTGSDNGLLPGQHQVIIWSNAGILLTQPLRTNFSEIIIKIQICSFKKMHWKMSRKWRPFCLCINVLTCYSICTITHNCGLHVVV